MSDSANELLQQFYKQKVSQESEVLQAAQRFVNQFRALKFFRESFVQEYNEQLLACSPDVRRFFPSLMGGNEVRNYLEFLEKQRQATDSLDTQNQSQIASNGYLPSPDSDLVNGNGTSESTSVSKEEFQQMQAQQRILMEQTQQLLKKMNQQTNSSSSSLEGRYSQIIEEDS